MGREEDKVGDLPRGEAGQFVALGKILRAQGNKGEVRVLPYGDSAEDFLRLETKEIFLRSASAEGVRGIELEDIWLHKGFAILKIAGCETLEQARALAGNEVLIRLEDRWALPRQEYYVDELIGLRVFDLVANEWLGEVSTFIFGSANDLMVIPYRGKELFVPFVRQIVREIDFQNRVIKVELPEGLREIN